jgi:hypothetical protein
MRVLVCGGRDFSDEAFLDGELFTEWQREKFDVIIQGHARGADSLAVAWAKSMNETEHAGIKIISFPADWKKHGKAAGPIRNTRMLKEGKPDVVIAFSGGAGTEDMVKKAKRAGVRVIDLRAGSPRS